MNSRDSRDSDPAKINGNDGNKYNRTPGKKDQFTTVGSASNFPRLPLQSGILWDGGESWTGILPESSWKRHFSVIRKETILRFGRKSALFVAGWLSWAQKETGVMAWCPLLSVQAFSGTSWCVNNCNWLQNGLSPSYLLAPTSMPQQGQSLSVTGCGQ